MCECVWGKQSERNGVDGERDCDYVWTADAFFHHCRFGGAKVHNNNSTILTRNLFSLGKTVRSVSVIDYNLNATLTLTCTLFLYIYITFCIYKYIMPDFNCRFQYRYDNTCRHWRVSQTDKFSASQFFMFHLRLAQPFIHSPHDHAISFAAMRGSVAHFPNACQSNDDNFRLYKQIVHIVKMLLCVFSMCFFFNIFCCCSFHYYSRIFSLILLPFLLYFTLNVFYAAACSSRAIFSSHSFWFHAFAFPIFRSRFRLLYNLLIIR